MSIQKHKPRLRSIFIFVALSVPMVVVGCGSDSTRISFQTGVVNGVIIFWEGDFMPGDPNGTKTPVERELYIFEEIIVDGRGETGPFYSNVDSELVEVTKSDTSGFFQVELPARTYSLFVKEGEQFYANSAGEYGRIMPVEVEPEKTTSIQIDITYMATF